MAESNCSTVSLCLDSPGRKRVGTNFNENKKSIGTTDLKDSMPPCLNRKNMVKRISASIPPAASKSRSLPIPISGRPSFFVGGDSLSLYLEWETRRLYLMLEEAKKNCNYYSDEITTICKRSDEASDTERDTISELSDSQDQNCDLSGMFEPFIFDL